MNRLLLVAVVAVVVASACSDDRVPTAESATAISSVAAPASTVKLTGVEHVDGEVDYPTSPGYGGDHNPAWMNCGVYRQEVVEEMAVHSLEHGAVWLTFHPDKVDAAGIDVLAAFAENATHVLVSPYSAQESPVVATAWGAQSTFDTVDDPGIAEFVSYFQQGPQTPEPGAPCSGAVGEPE